MPHLHTLTPVSGDAYSYQDSYQAGQSSSAFPYYDNQPAASSSSAAMGYNRTDGHQEEGWEQEPDPADPNSLYRRPTDVLRTMAGFEESHAPPIEFHDDVIDDYWDDEEEQDPSMFLNLSLLSHIAVQLRDKVPRGTHVKSSIPYERAFTGKDIVVRAGNLS
jgi:RHO1 GDP-GTP exchange protein 1/2